MGERDKNLAAIHDFLRGNHAKQVKQLLAELALAKPEVAKALLRLVAK